MLRESFVFNAPSDTPPSNLSLTGPDASLFQVVFEVTNANGNGDRTVTIIVTRTDSRVGNFENPADADDDNVYAFTVSGTYQNRNITSDISITVTDVLDQAEIVAKPFLAPLNESGFGSHFVEIPDITGDGVSEIALVNGGSDTTTLDAAYIIPSEALSGTVTQEDFSDSTVYLTRILAPAGAANDAAFVSARENSDNSVDILASFEGTNKAIVYHIPSGQRDGSFAGDQSPDAFDVQSYILDLQGINGTSKATLIDDINGDGKSDIFVRAIFEPSGLIFGDDSRLNSESVAAFDIAFIQTVNAVSGPTFPPYVAKPIEDIDGDMIEDLFLLRENRIVFISGAVLRESGRTQLDFDTMTPSQGFYIDGNAIDITLFEDFDQDGLPSLIFAPYESAGSSSFGLSVVDADDFLAFASQSGNTDLFEIARFFAADNGGEGLNFVRRLPDIDGDGLDEVMSFTRSFGDFAQIYFGSGIQTAIELSAPINQIADIDESHIFRIDIAQQNSSSRYSNSSAAFLDGSSLTALGLTCSGPITQPCSGVRVLDQSEVNAAITSNAPSLLIRGEE
jgi:hypothetical protein